MLILLTGKQGAGKTTACWKALPGLRATGVKIAGFISPPLLDGNATKTGIEMVNLATGKHQTFAHIVGPDETPTVGVYRLVEGATDWARHVLAAAILADTDWLVIDEIGPLELEQNGGFAFVLDPLGDPERIPNAIVLVRQKFVDKLSERIGRSDSIAVHVTQENRGDIPGRLVQLVRETQAKTG